LTLRGPSGFLDLDKEARMARYGRDFGGRGPGRNPGGQWERNYVPHDPAIDRGYRRGGYMGSGMGRSDTGFGGGTGGGPGWSGSAGRFGGGGPWDAYGSGDMGITFGNTGRGGPRRRGMPGRRGMRYDVGYGMGNDREWF
jgi:hypothetical protein